MTKSCFSRRPLNCNEDEHVQKPLASETQAPTSSPTAARSA